MENIVYHKASQRGFADHGWLKAYHSFSFANWYDPNKVHFGVLRVLNDDTIAPGMGFGMHPHDNMEIITIPLEGDLAHKDSMGNEAIIKFGDVQVMSAGTGVRHSEFNPNGDQRTKLLQIWLFPKQQNVTPRYQQISLNKEDCLNKLQQVLSPNLEDDGVWIYQDAWFHIGKFERGVTTKYNLKRKGNGIYVFVISGSISIDENILETRDAIGVWNTSTLKIKAKSNAEFLIMDIPMEIPN